MAIREDLKPLCARTLKDDFIDRFEELILSGALSPEEKLPGERELAERLGVSRPVVRDGLKALEERGLVRVEPRRGAFVADYRRDGSVALLEGLVKYASPELSPRLFNGLLEMRVLFETEAARLAATKRDGARLAALEAQLAREAEMGPGASAEDVAAVDFEFHLEIAIASGNDLYPLLMNSFKDLYLAMLRRFYADGSAAARVFELHRAQVEAIRSRDGPRSAEAMRAILSFGESGLRSMLAPGPEGERA
jgi:DNA-binding FadR family transcriptional regulator